MSGAEAVTPTLTRGTNIARQVEVPLHNNSLQATPRTARFVSQGTGTGVLKSKPTGKRGG
jgi:hypothetical protein